MMTISGGDLFALGAVICGLAWLGFAIDGTALGRRIAGVVWVLTIAMILSNSGFIPRVSPVYEFVADTLVPLAIPMLLLKADLRRIFSESGRVLLTFALAAAAVVVAAIVGFHLIELGPAGAKVAGTYASGWIGGAVNFLAVSQSVGMTPEEFGSAMGAGSPISNIALLLLVLIPSTPWIVRIIPSPIMAATREERTHAALESEAGPLVPRHIVGIFAVSFTICAVARWLSRSYLGQEYEMLVITALSLALANLMATRMATLRGDFDMGVILMYLFFAVVGAGTDAMAFLVSAMHFFAYGLFIIASHFLIVLTVARLFRLDLAEVIVGSAAALVGPAVTAAIATSQGWRDLVTPGILCGILGYALGTFIGVGITRLLG